MGVRVRVLSERALSAEEAGPSEGTCASGNALLLGPG